MSKKRNKSSDSVKHKLVKGVLTASLAVSAIPVSLAIPAGEAEASTLVSISTKAKGDIVSLRNSNGSYTHFEVIKRTTEGVKVRAMEAIELPYSSSGKNVYDIQDKNNIAYKLNGKEFLDSFSKKERDLFVEATWNIGDETRENSKQLEAKVGLLTKSELKEAYTNPGKLTVSIGEQEWLLTPNSKEENSVWSVTSSGKEKVEEGDVFLYARPVVVLKSDLTVDSNGVITDKLENYNDKLLQMERIMSGQVYSQDPIGDLEYLLRELTAIGVSQKEVQDMRTKVEEYKKYSKANEAVKAAEFNKHQSYINAAQTAVNELTNQQHYRELQSRIDVLKNQLNSINEQLWKDFLRGADVRNRMQELANLLEQAVYPEFADNYASVITDLLAGQTQISKADAVKAVRLVNSFELAKRSMNQNDIRAYASELRTASPYVSYNFPSEQLLIATANYTIAPNDRTKETLLKNLASALNTTTLEVEKEVKALMAKMQGITKGTYKVEYLDIDGGNKVFSFDYSADFGTITVVPEAPHGYKLVSVEPITYDFKLEDTGKVFSFKVVKEEVLTSYTIKYVNTKGEVVSSKEFREQKLGEVTAAAEIPDGYILAEGQTETVTFNLTEDNKDKEVVFLVVNKSEVEEENVSDQLEEVDAAPNDESSDSSELDAVEGTQSEQPEEEEGVRLEENIVSTFTVDTRPPTNAVASTNNLYFSSTPTEITILGDEYKEYSILTAKAAMLVGEYLANPNEVTKKAVRDFVNKELASGEYKFALLNLLKEPYEVLDTQLSFTNLQVYNPLPQNVPVNNNPNNVQNNKPPQNTTTAPNTTVRPQVNLKPASIADKKKPTADDKKDKENTSTTQAQTNGSTIWTIANPTEKSVEVKDKGIQVTLELGSTVGKVESLEVAWSQVQTGHYKLSVKADGKEISDYKATVIFEGDYQYVQRKVSAGYKATPYAFAGDKFVIKNVVGATYYFHSNVKSFTDTDSNVKGVDYIHEMASRGILKGTGGGKFSPHRKVTRAHFAAIITRSLGLTASDKQTPFLDTRGEWYEEEIQALYEAGLVYGTTRTNYSPNDHITGQQAAMMLYRVLTNSEAHNKLVKENSDYASAIKPTFKDADKIAKEAEEAVAKLESLGVLEGTTGGKFNPYSTWSRADLVKAIYKTLIITGDL